MEKPKQGIHQLPFEWDVTPLAQYVKTITEADWDKWSYRQQTFKQHEHTRSIKVQWIPLNVSFYDTSKIEISEPYYSELKVYLKDVYRFLEQYYDGVVYKVLVTELKPQTSIPPHTDGGFSLTVPHRIHIPVITNTSVIFGCGDVVLNMVPGSVYEINNQRRHFVENNSNEHRIHIIVDIIEKNHIGNQ